MLSIEQMKAHVNVNQLETPVLVFDQRELRRKFTEIRESVAGAKVYYAVKANSHPEILKYLHGLGSGFEVASTNEMNGLLKLGVSAQDIISSNTLKLPSFITAAHAAGLEYFAYDTEMEIDKLSDLAPGAKVYLRVVVDNTGSEIPLSNKFGVDPSRALDLLRYARSSRVTPVGITFQVGSQCLNPLNWGNALMTAAEIFRQAAKVGIELNLINLGGGIPVKHLKPTPKLAEIKYQIEKVLKDAFSEYPGLQLMIAPGRGVIGDSAIMVASVIARAERGSENWLYLDVGVFNGLMETINGLGYELVSERELGGFADKLELVPYAVAGPSCESIDTMFRDCRLPKDLVVGDRIYIKNAGAYTLSYGSNFSGLEPPRLVFIEDK